MKHAPECVNRSQCREIVINGQVPLDWALPLYGYIMPIIVAITLATNSFIVLVLSHKYLRTPTNFVLLAMAVSELLTGLSCLPWLLYYYTFKGYQTDQEYGLPPFWCSMFPYLASILPSIFHTAAIWLTVYLAVQRYIYICMPKLVKNHCTIARSRCVIMCIFMASAWIYAPELFATYNQSYEMESHRFYNRTYRVCMRVRTTFIQVVGSNAYYYILYGLHTVLAHTLPCILLVLFTCKLISAIRQADRRHAVLISKPREAYRKYTEGSIDPSSIEQVVTRKFSQLVRGRGSVNESRRVQGLKQNTRMLIVVILLFLMTEIPAALIFSLHVSTVALQITFIQRHYAMLNKLLIVRNVLIVVSYPFRFAIYCGMSQQFREVARQMITHRVFFPCSKRAREVMKNANNANRKDTNGSTQLSHDGKNADHQSMDGIVSESWFNILRDKQSAPPTPKHSTVYEPLLFEGRSNTVSSSTDITSIRR